VKELFQQTKSSALIYLCIFLILSFVVTIFFSSASLENKTAAVESGILYKMILANNTNIILVRGAISNGSI
jgi:hypothetical protein